MRDETLMDGAYFADRVQAAARMARFTESPIEIMFGMALYDLLEDDWNLIPQFKFGKYRIDWALELPHRKAIFVECDGSEFHTRPDQVMKDRWRDVSIRRAGHKLFRFTGSEIYRNAEGCALKVYFEAIKP